MSSSSRPAKRARVAAPPVIRLFSVLCVDVLISMFEMLSLPDLAVFSSASRGTLRFLRIEYRPYEIMANERNALFRTFQGDMDMLADVSRDYEQMAEIRAARLQARILYRSEEFAYWACVSMVRRWMILTEERVLSLAEEYGDYTPFAILQQAQLSIDYEALPVEPDTDDETTDLLDSDSESDISEYLPSEEDEGEESEEY